MGSDAQGVAVPRPLHTTVASLEQSGKLPLAVIVEPLLNLGQQLMGPNERVALPFRPSPFPSDRRPSLPTAEAGHFLVNMPSELVELEGGVLHHIKRSAAWRGAPLRRTQPRRFSMAQRADRTGPTN